MIGHVGNKVGALVDGQLPAAEAERLWSHVLECPGCSSAVEREGWIKTRLAGLRQEACQPEAPNHLRAILCEPHLAGSGESMADARGAHRRHPVVVAVLGAGSVGAAMVGVFALTMPAQGPNPDRRGPVTSVTLGTELSGNVQPATATGGVVGAPVFVGTDGPHPGAVDDSYPQWVRISR